MSRGGGLGKGKARSKSKPTSKPKAKAPSRKGTDLRHGLPMVAKWEPAKLAKDRALLVALDKEPTVKRWAGYAKRLGPGFMQSAMTLGSGSAGSSLFAGALVGYGLLWVQPLAMFFGVIMLMAIAYQTLSTGVRPFDALRRHVHPALAWAFAIGSLIATVIWHFPQYSMGAASASGLLGMAGLDVPAPWLAIPMLVVCTAVTWSYGAGAKGIRVYETVIKYLVWGVVFSFAAVVIKLAAEGKIQWGEVAKGYVSFRIPEASNARLVMFGGFGAAVGVNMVFLFPYTLLARGWGKEHRNCSRFDLAVGMFVPFVLATSLMVIATAATMYQPGIDPGKVGPAEASKALAPVVGDTFGLLIFGLGVLGMCLSTITLHMLVSGFIVCECLNWEPTGWRYYVATLIPIPGALGPLFWGDIAFWLAAPMSAICGALLPLAYVGFIVLFNKKAYMGDAMPRGSARVWWNIGMGGAMALSLVYLVTFITTQLVPWVTKALGGAA